MTISKVKDHKRILQIFDDFANDSLVNNQDLTFIKFFKEQIGLQIFRSNGTFLEAWLNPHELTIKQANPNNEAELEFLSRLKGEAEVQNTLFNT
jgi:hypothetical protein